jgi:hypothetical protein
MVFTGPLTDISNKSRKVMFLGSRARPVRRTDNFIAICELVVYAMFDPVCSQYFAVNCEPIV